MALNVKQKKEIEKYLITKIRNKLSTYNPETNFMPFHHRLLGKDRMALFSFIHSVNTMLGTSIFEQVGKIIALPKSKQAIDRYDNFEGFVSSKAVLTIDNIMRDILSASRKPNKKKETKEVLSASRIGKKGKKLKKRVDLFVEKNNGVEYFFEIKTAKPNIDVFKSVKRQLLEWIAMRGSIDNKIKDISTIIAIPYNPYEPQPYERWTLQGLFDLKNEVLVGKDFWDFLGGVNTYEDLLDVFKKAGFELYEEIDKKMKNIKKT